MTFWTKSRQWCFPSPLDFILNLTVFAIFIKATDKNITRQNTNITTTIKSNSTNGLKFNKWVKIPPKMWLLRLCNFSAAFMFFSYVDWLCILKIIIHMTESGVQEAWWKKNIEPEKGKKKNCSENKIYTSPCCSTLSTVHRTCIDTYSKYSAYLPHPYSQKGSPPTHDLMQAKQF